MVPATDRSRPLPTNKFGHVSLMPLPQKNSYSREFMNLIFDILDSENGIRLGKFGNVKIMEGFGYTAVTRSST